MSGALKWSPFESARWPDADDGAGRAPSGFTGAIGRVFDPNNVPVPVHNEEVRVADVRVEEFVDRETESDGRSDGNGHHSGLRYRPFTRNLPLPEGVTDTDIKVSFRDGVLEVRTPLPAAPLADAPEKRLPISRE